MNIARLHPALKLSHRTIAKSHLSHRVYSQIALSKFLLVPSGFNNKSDYQDYQLALLGDYSPLPCVGRELSLSSVAKTMIANIILTTTDNDQPPLSTLQNILLVCAGQVDGTGKTLFGEKLFEKVQEKLESMTMFAGSSVVKVVVAKVDDLKSMYDLWTNNIVLSPKMNGLASLINESMPLPDLLKVTSTYLRENKLLLYLHLDEFNERHANVQRVFLNGTSSLNRTGDLKSSEEMFLSMWRSSLIPIIRSPRIMMYVAGESCVLDKIGAGESGQSFMKLYRPCMDLLTRESVKEILDKFSVYQRDGAPKSLATVLLDILCEREGCSKGEALDQIVNGIHKLSGGVPLFIELALTAMTTLPAVEQCVESVKHKNSVALDTIMTVLGENGTALKSDRFSQSLSALKTQVEDRLNSTGMRLQERLYTDLLRLFNVSGQILPCSLVEYEACLLSSASPTAQLLHAAQFWGVHHSFDVAAQGVRFVMPEASQMMLRGFRDTALHQLRINRRRNSVDSGVDDVSSVANEEGVLYSLALDRLSLTTVGSSPCWLEDIMQRYLGRSGVFKKIFADKEAMEMWRSTATVTILPAVQVDGRATLEEVMLFDPLENSKLHPDAQTVSNYETLVQRLQAGGVNQVYRIYSSQGVKSATFDHLVRHNNYWLHFQLTGVEHLNALDEAWKVLHCVVELTPPGSQHVLVFQNSIGSAAEALCSLRDQLTAIARNKTQRVAIDIAFVALPKVGVAPCQKDEMQLSGGMTRQMQELHLQEKVRAKKLQQVLKVLVDRKGFVDIIVLSQQDSAELAERGKKILNFESLSV